MLIITLLDILALDILGLDILGLDILGLDILGMILLSCAQIHCRAGATSPVGQVSTGPLFSPSALTADLGDYDVCGSIDEQSTGSTELAA